MFQVNAIFFFTDVVFVKLAIGLVGRGRWVGVGGFFWLNIRNGFEEPFNKIQNQNMNLNLNFTINSVKRSTSKKSRHLHNSSLQPGNSYINSNY